MLNVQWLKINLEKINELDLMNMMNNNMRHDNIGNKNRA